MKAKTYKILLTIMILFVSLFSYNSTYVYASNSNILGTAGDFSIFVLNDHIHRNSDCTGRIAVGNNATYENYSIGNSLPLSTTRSDLIVGGALSAVNGNNFSGNTSVSPSGNVIRYTMTNNNNVPNQPRRENIIDFNSERRYLTNKTRELSSLPSSGNISNHYGQLNLTSSNRNLVVFNLSTQDVSGINGINIDVPETATVIINIIGKNINIGNLAIFYKMREPSKDIFRKWLWNFPQTENLNFYGISVKGSILAPYATFNATGFGNIDGTIILNNFYNYNTGFEVHNNSFIGSIPGNDNNTNDNTQDKDLTGDTTNNNVPPVNTPPEEKPSEGTTTEETSPETDNIPKENKADIEEEILGINDIKDNKDVANENEYKSSSNEKGPKTGDSIKLGCSVAITIITGVALVFLRKFK